MYLCFNYLSVALFFGDSRHHREMEEHHVDPVFAHIVGGP